MRDHGYQPHERKNPAPGNLFPRSSEEVRTAYPPIGEHGVIGDRRTAALVTSNGTMDWLCLPHYDSPPLFGTLLDHEKRGFWRIGPETPIMGRHAYLPDTAALDASVLLIPVMGFLPADHPQVRATVDRIATDLMRDGFVYRLDPNGMPQPSTQPLGGSKARSCPARFGWRPLMPWRVGLMKRKRS